MTNILLFPVEIQTHGIQAAPTTFSIPSHQQQDDSKQVATVSDRPDMVLLSSKYNEQNFADEIVSEVLNNGTESAEYVEALAS